MSCFFVHLVLGSLFVSLENQLVWHSTLPDGRWSRYVCVHMLTRFAPDKGHPQQECCWSEIFEAMLKEFLVEVSFEVARRVDPGLASLAMQLPETPVSPALKALRKLLPLNSRLSLVDCGRTEAGQHFDVYLRQENNPKLLPLNLWLAGLFPSVMLDGALRIQVPLVGEEVNGALLLSQALAVRLRGANAEPLPYSFDVVY